MIAKSCFRRLARDIANGYKHGLRFREEALDGLQEAVETQIVRLLANANKVAVAEGRMTLQSKDLHIAKSIMEDSKINIPARVARAARSPVVAPEETPKTAEDIEDIDDIEDTEDTEDTEDEEDDQEDDQEDTEDGYDTAEDQEDEGFVIVNAQ